MTLTVQRPDGPDLVLRHAARFAEAFFRLDPSAARPGAYDTEVLREPIHQVVVEDIHAINRTMAARSNPARWSDLTGRDGANVWLQRIDPAWNLFAVSDDDWPEVRKCVQHAFQCVLAPYRGLSVSTKVLHLKRPELIPVCDQFVCEVLGAHVSGTPGAGTYLAGSLGVLDHIRAEGRRNRAALDDIQRRLVERGVPRRSLVRIFDALLWSSHPKAWIYPLWQVLG